MPALLLREGSAKEAQLNESRLEQLDLRCSEWVKQGLTDSLITIVARHGVVAFHEAYGRIAPEPDARALEKDDMFPISSLSKPFTATALMMLMEQGLVHVNKPVIDYLPEMADVCPKDVQVRHLLTHTSGFEEEDLMAFQMKMHKKIELPPLPDNQHKVLHSVLHSRFGCPPQRQPNEMMSYCNHGYNLITEIIRRVCGTSFEQFMQEQLLQPLGMSSSSFRLKEQFKSKMVKRSPIPDNMFGVDLNNESYLDIPWGSAGLLSTARDIAQFGQMFLNQGSYGDHQLLSRAAVKTMTSNQIPQGVPEKDILTNVPQGSYGYGWFIFGDHPFMMNGVLVPKGSYSHGGMGGSLMWVDPLNDLVGVLLQVWKFEEGVVPGPPDNPPKLNTGIIQDMITSAVL